jgi:hypothetical protein
MKVIVSTAISVIALTFPVIGSAHHALHTPHSHIKPISVSKGSASTVKPIGSTGDALPATQSGHRAAGDSLDPMYHGGG